MNAEAIMSVSAAVVALTQLAKWARTPDSYGPVVVMILSLIGVAFWGWSQNDFTRATSFGYFVGWITVTTASAGIFGFTRAGADAVTKTMSPPSGAGGSPTGKGIGE